MTTEFRDIFDNYYPFMGFVEATGLKAPIVGMAYNSFRDFSYNHTLENGMPIISECFETWMKTQSWVD